MNVQKSIVALAFACALGTACAIDPTDGIAGSRGPAGSLGSECTCPNGQADCDGNQSQCQSGLSCLRTDSGNQICTQNCPCPLQYVCKSAGVPGARLACFKRP